MMVMRCVVAGTFVYMALFELAPPHTHSRTANTCYLLCFAAGAALSYGVELTETLTESFKLAPARPS